MKNVTDLDERRANRLLREVAEAADREQPQPPLDPVARGLGHTTALKLAEACPEPGCGWLTEPLAAFHDHEGGPGSPVCLHAVYRCEAAGHCWSSFWRHADGFHQPRRVLQQRTNPGGA